MPVGDTVLDIRFYLLIPLLKRAVITQEIVVVRRIIERTRNIKEPAAFLRPAEDGA
jgi:hypothetical protein